MRELDRLTRPIYLLSALTCLVLALVTLLGGLDMELETIGGLALVALGRSYMNTALIIEERSNL